MITKDENRAVSGKQQHTGKTFPLNKASSRQFDTRRKYKQKSRALHTTKANSFTSGNLISTTIRIKQAIDETCKENMATLGPKYEEYTFINSLEVSLSQCLKAYMNLHSINLLCCDICFTRKSPWLITLQTNSSNNQTLTTVHQTIKLCFSISIKLAGMLRSWLSHKLL